MLDFLQILFKQAGYQTLPIHVCLIPFIIKCSVYLDSVNVFLNILKNLILSILKLFSFIVFIMIVM